MWTMTVGEPAGLVDQLVQLRLTVVGVLGAEMCNKNVFVVASVIFK